MGYNYLLAGKDKEGLALLQEVKCYVPDHSVCGEVLAEDILNGNADAACVNSMFMHVDETRESILKKKKAIEECLEKNPGFRSGYFGLAIAWLQLHRLGDALVALQKYHEVRPEDPTAQYYLAIIHAERLDYNNAWKHYRRAEQLVNSRHHNPKALKEARKALKQLSPEYIR